MRNKLRKTISAVVAFLMVFAMFAGFGGENSIFPAITVHAVNTLGTGNVWEDGDEIRLLRWADDRHTNFFLTAEVAEDGAVTWTPDKKLYWDGKGEHTLVASYPNMNLLFDNFGIPVDQSDLQKLKEADCMNAMWKGNPTTEPINLTLKHRLSMVTVTYTFASEFADEPDITPEVYNNTRYVFFNIHTLERQEVAWEEGDDAWVKAYKHEDENGEKKFTAIVSPDTYSADDEFIRIKIGDQVLTAKMKEDITFQEGTHYTFNLKVGKDKVEIDTVTVIGDFPGGWENEVNLDRTSDTIGTADKGKADWVDNDQTFTHLYSQEYRNQAVTMTYGHGEWQSDGGTLSYLNNETPTITAVYAPDFEIKSDKTIGLIDGKQYGEAEYIRAQTTISGNTLDIRFDSGRTYSRLRIAVTPGTRVAITTEGFTPAGAASKNDFQMYELEVDEKGNAYLYGTFAAGGKVTVETSAGYQVQHSFDTPTEAEQSYALNAIS